MDESIAFDEVQANILLPYPRANCSRLVFLRFDPDQRVGAKKWVRKLRKKVAFHNQVRDENGSPLPDAKGPWFNIGFTHAGLEALGFDPYSLKYVPDDFTEGMASRAERLGDIEDPARDEHEVHAVVMIYAYDERVAEHAERVGDDVYTWQPLSPSRIKDLEYAVDLALEAPFRGLKVESAPGVYHIAELDHDTYSLVRKGVGELEYFGFRDGISQPRIVSSPDGPTDTEASAVLLGYPIRTKSLSESTRQEIAAEHLRHGSYLVMRKLSQDVEGFRSDLESRAKDLPEMEGRDLAEMMVGRHQDGEPLVEHDERGDFTYESDPHGRKCPFQSHVRRTNPRGGEKTKIRRIMRRAMPYSNYRHRENDQGLFFQAYNANIEAQFEFVQRLWMNSGVENHGLSRDRDPVASEPIAPGDAEEGKASFSFTNPKNQCPHTVTGLQSHVYCKWGEYFLVPSRKTLVEIGDKRDNAIALFRARVAGLDLPHARDVLGRWLDDPPMSKRLWEAVREAPGGVVRLEEVASVLVGTVENMEKVLYDDGSTYSVRNQGEAMRQTTGAFYLGMDPSEADYQRDHPTSEAIVPGWEKGASGSSKNKASLEEVALSTVELCYGFLGAAVTEAIADHDKPGSPRQVEIDIRKFAAFVLAGLTPKIFGVPQPSAVGTFTMNIPASGYIFFPFPEETFLEYAEKAGRGIGIYLADLFDDREARKSGEAFRHEGDPLHARVATVQRPDDSWKKKLDDNLAALEELYQSRDERYTRDDAVRLMSGVISGMLITCFKTFTDGVSEHVKEFAKGEPIKVPGDVRRLPFDALRERHRSMPNVIYRQNVGGDHQLGGVDVHDGDFVLTCQGSAMADREEEKEEWFYGDRTPTDYADARAPHFCPGYKMADTLLGEMSRFLLSGELGVSNLRRTDDEGFELACDFAPAHQTVAALKQQKKGGAGGDGREGTESD